MTPRLASGPVCWGVDFADGPGSPDWREVLDGIAAAGYEGTELGPLGFLPRQPEPFARRGLSLAGGFIFEPLHDPLRSAGVVRLAERVAAAVAELGGDYLLIIDSVTARRAATAGRSEDAERLGAGRRDAMTETVASAASAAAGAGLTPLLHPHAGTYVEFADEIEPLRAVCGLCIDTGHLTYAGIDPVALFSADPGSVGSIHLKDVATARIAPDFWSSVGAGAFVPLGDGDVDFAGLLEAVGAAGYEGWMVVEQDRVPGAGEPVRDLVASRRFLESLA